MDFADIAQLASLLRRPVNDDLVLNFLGPLIFKIERDAHYGSVNLKGDGLEVVFKEAPWVVPDTEIVDPKRLHLSAVHLHRDGHEGHSQYLGKLPNGVAFGDSKADLLRKMGEPISTGGGGMSSFPLNRPIPHWLKYKIGDAILHVQLDDADCIQMVTLMARDIPPLSK